MEKSRESGKMASSQGECALRTQTLVFVIVCHKRLMKHAGVAVLVTGDGASMEDEEGFIPALQDMADAGWGLSWSTVEAKSYWNGPGKMTLSSLWMIIITFQLEPGKEGDGQFRCSDAQPVQ